MESSLRTRTTIRARSSSDCSKNSPMETCKLKCKNCTENSHKCLKTLFSGSYCSPGQLGCPDTTEGRSALTENPAEICCVCFNMMMFLSEHRSLKILSIHDRFVEIPCIKVSHLINSNNLIIEISPWAKMLSQIFYLYLQVVTVPVSYTHLTLPTILLV